MADLSTVPTAPGRKPLLGHVLELRRRPLEFFHSLREYGPLVRVFLGPLPVYLVTRPELVHEILVRNAKAYRKGRLFDKVRAFLGNGLLTSEGEFHQRQRRLMQPAFHRKRIAEHVDLMRRNAERSVANCRPGELVEMQRVMYELTLKNVTEALFASDLRPGASEEILRWLPVVLRGSAARTLAPFDFLHRLPTPENRRFTEADRRFRRVIDELVDSARSDGSDRGDVLSLVLAARDEDTGRGMTDAQARDELVNLLLAGAETAGSTLGSVFHRLSRHPDVQRRVAEEVDKVLDGRAVTSADLPALEFTQAVVDEVLRLDQPVWILMRRTAVATTLGDTRLPAGVELMFSGSALHRSPEIYADPLAFDPDRWLARARAVPPGAYVPFGGGNRQCIGDTFALTEMVVTVATFLAHRRFEAATPAEPTRLYGILSHLDRLPLRVCAR